MKPSGDADQLSRVPSPYVGELDLAAPRFSRFTSAFQPSRQRPGMSLVDPGQVDAILVDKTHGSTRDSRHGNADRL